MTRPSLNTYLVENFNREYGNARQLLLDASDLPADGVSTLISNSVNCALSDRF
ncbi:MAG: hypothetical protein AAGG53_17120 [Cyanobacteria bacterium P01_H01_bin.152]